MGLIWKFGLLRRQGMRGFEGAQVELFAYVQLESRIPKDPPLRWIKLWVDHVLSELDGER